MTTAELMAIAVLRGDMVAARQLSDVLQEEYGAGAIELPPIKKLTSNINNLRIIIFHKDHATTEDMGNSTRAIQQWIQGDGTVKLLNAVQIDRIEFWELP